MNIDTGSCYYVSERIEYRGFVIKCEPNHGDGSFTNPYRIYDAQDRRVAFAKNLAGADLAKRFIDAEITRQKQAQELLARGD